MANREISGGFLLFTILLFLHGPHVGGVATARNSSPSPANTLQTYIVHVKKPESIIFATSVDRENWHRSFLAATVKSSSEPRLIYSYSNVISGFAARLTESELEAMQSIEGFLQAYPDKLLNLQTTRTPEFLGLNQPPSVWIPQNYGEGVIIGVIDTGITPGHPSFSGDNLPPPPGKWKGKCQFNYSSGCNNKLIGARAFINGAAAMKGGRVMEGEASPIDELGHGTHVASTAAGWSVRGANVLGQAGGTAAGMAPSAHLAVYRVCNNYGCRNSDVLAGIDAAVDDGVDVVSISLSATSLPFDKDNIAIGALRAVEKGIFVSCSAANDGPEESTLSNEAPWILTVAASTIDRRIRVTVKLGNGLEVDGECTYQPKVSASFPLVYPGDSGKFSAAFCGSGSLEGINVRGKIVLCENGGGIGRLDKGVTVKNAGGVGMILANSVDDGDTTMSDPHILPASHVSYSDGSRIKAYLNTTSSPTAAFISKGTILGVLPAPVMASFSSRGPSIASPGILKPDITGPGLNIIAAWPFPVGPTLPNPTPTHYFNIIAGTSMSTPHLSGIAALIKSAHRDWSPAMIKSAMMTTADVQDRAGNPILDERGKPAGFFATGAGHVKPAKAMDPGLVYDIRPASYLQYLCGLGYSSAKVSAIAARPVNCGIIGSILEKDLNYPAIRVVLSGSNRTVSVRRRVKNVGEAQAIYSAVVDARKGVDISVEPKTLQFNAVNEEKNFMVTFSGHAGGGAGTVEGQLRWVSGQRRVVRSPISITFA